MPLYKTLNIPELAHFVFNIEVSQLNGEVESESQYPPINPKTENHEEFYKQYQPLVLDEVMATLQTAVTKFDKKNIVAVNLQDKDQFRFYPQDNITMLNMKNDGRIRCDDIGGFQFIVCIVYLNSSRTIGVLNIYQEEYQLALKDNFSEFFNDATHFKIYPLASLVNLDRMYSVCVQKPNTKLLRKVMTASVSSWSKITNNASPSPLNAEQKLASEGLLQAEDGLYLLQGPPGTGKTTTVVSMIEQFVTHDTPALICAPSNKAVQVLAERALIKMPFAPLLLTAVENKITSSRLQEISFDNWINRYPNKLKIIVAEIDIQLLLSSKRLNAATIKDIIDYEALTKFTNELDKKIKVINDILRVCARYVISMNPSEFISLATLADKDLNEYLSNLQLLRQFIIKDAFPELGTKKEVPVLTQEKKTKINAMIDRLLKKYTEINTFILHYVLKECPNEQNSLYERAQILFCTLSIAGRTSLIRQYANLNWPFEYLIIDEAGQAVEAESLIPFNLARNAKKVLLVGDTRQLPATTIAVSSKHTLFDHSMMWRLLEVNQQPFHSLNVQYRMRAKIKHFPSNRYYQGRLQDHDSIKNRSTHLPSHIMHSDGIKLWLNLDSQEERSGLSFINRSEALAILSLIKAIRAYDTKSHIGVISFYSAQIRLIGHMLKDENKKNSNISPDNIAVHTVDGFQGDEKDIMIVSFVRANPQHDIGFLNDFRRLNVAITRAKDLLYILGNAATFNKAQGSEIKELLEYLKQANAIVPFHNALFQIQNSHQVSGSSSSRLPDVSPIKNVTTATHKPTKSATVSISNKYQLFTIPELLDQAKRYFEKMQYENAIKNYEHILEQEPNRKGIYPLLAECYVKMGNLEQAELIKLIASSEATSGASANIVTESSTASSASNTNNNGFTALPTKTIKPTLRKARELCDAGQYAEAEILYTELLDKHSENSEILLGLAWSLNKQRKHVKAARYFTLSLQITKSPLAYHGLIHCKSLMNDFEGALDLACEALDYFPWSNSIAALKNNIETRTFQSKNTNLSTVVAHEKPAINTTKPMLSDFIPNVSKSRPSTNQVSGSSSSQQVDKPFSDVDQQLFNRACSISKDKKDARNAEIMFNELHKRYPYHPLVSNELGWCLHILKRNAEAIPILEKALEKTNHHDAYYGLARCYRFTDDFKTSLEYIEQGLKYHPDSKKLQDFKKEVTELIGKFMSRPNKKY